jgi:hypothetical protein
MTPTLRFLLVLALLLAAGAAYAEQDQPAIEALRARHAALKNDLAQNAFGRPLHLESAQTEGEVSGNVHAVLEHPFARLNAALHAADHWCDILILHLNIKQCRSAPGASVSTLTVYIGTKRWQSLESAERIVFDFHVRADTSEYLRLELRADDGPLGARNFRIELEAIPLEAGRSFIHMSYAYTFGTAARLAMLGYLRTVGRGKVGFTVVDRTADDKPVYVGDERGVTERNTMRYYLAIDAYVDTFDPAPAEQLDRRLRQWFTATEQYPRQLHEVDEAEYLDMKRREIERQRRGSAG